MRKSKLILLLILGAAVIAGIVGYMMWNKPHKQVEDMASITVTATDLCREYVENEDVANKKYLNKAVEVTGNVSGVTNNQDGYTLVTLQGDDATTEVECTMRDKDIKLENGRTITMKGFCSGYVLFGVKLTDCVVIK